MLQSNGRLIAAQPAALTAATSAPAALLALGLTVLPLSLHHAGFFPFGPAVLGIFLFYGGLSLIVVGLLEWRRGNAFGSVLFTPLGLFWLSLIGLAALPEAGLAQAPRPSTMVVYLVMWGFFAAILCDGARRLGREVAVVLALLTALFFLLAAGIASGSPALLTVAGCEGIACGFSALYAGIARFIGGACDRSGEG
jgi:hypothetical protein